MSVLIPSISIPVTKKDLWMNMYSEKSIISWFNGVCERRKKKNTLEMKKLKEKLYKNSKKRGSAFKSLCHVEHCDFEYKGWRQVFFDLYEENTNGDDDVYIDEEDDFFSFLRK